MTEIYFTSDQHYFHKRIIKYCKGRRQFAFESEEEIEAGNISKNSINAMNEAMIERHNSFVKPDNIIYNLGDFSFGNEEETISIFNRLNGRKRLIRGNHDSDFVWNLPWEEKALYAEISINGQFIVMCHYKFDVFNRSHKNSLNLFAHSHGHAPMNKQQIDVGVDVFNYTPVNLSQIKDFAKRLPDFRQSDMHNGL